MVVKFFVIFLECGGKNFHFVHKSGDLESVVNGTIRSAFEYGGQKCSACSRMYIPQSMWPEVKEKMLKIHKEIQVGSPLEVETFVSAVIDDKVNNNPAFCICADLHFICADFSFHFFTGKLRVNVIFHSSLLTSSISQLYK